MLAGATVCLLAFHPLAASAQPPSSSDAPTTPSERPGERPGQRPGERRPGEPPPLPPAEPPFVERPTIPTERLIPAPAIPPLPTDVAPPAPPGPSIPSVAGTPVLPSAGRAGLPPAAVFELHPSIGLTEEFTDNFNQTRDKQSNFRTALSPGFTLFVNSPVTKGTIQYAFSAAHDSSSSDAIELFHSLAGRIAWDATPLLTLTLSDSLTHSDEPSQADRLSLRRERSTFTSNQFSADLTYRLRGLEIHPYYRNSYFSSTDGETTNSHNIGATAQVPIYELNKLTVGYEYLDSTTSDSEKISGHQVTAAVSRQLNRWTSAGLSMGVSIRDESGDAVTAGTGQGYTLWNTSVFGSYTFPGRLRLDTSLGFSVLVPKREDRHTGISTATTLSYRSGGLTAILSIDSGFSETFALGENFGIVDTRGATATLQYAFTQALSASLGAFYRENDFTGVAEVQGVNQGDDKETTWGGTAAINLRLLSWLDLGLQYSYTRATSSGGDAGDNFSENRVQAFLRASF